VRPARCDRSREAISLRLDGVLSLFESALLERHLRKCADCSDFSAVAAAQTQLLRSAELEQPLRPVAIP
jgi:predicted anti-sigma-YlaC factor YlaD